MALYDPSGRHRNREWRRFVRVRARIRCTDGWRDASILNVSSHGLMVYSACCADPGRTVEIRSGPQAIRARVIWCKGQRLGLRSDCVLPVMDIVGLSESARASQAHAGQMLSERRTTPRPDSRFSGGWSRLLELASTLVVAIAVASTFAPMGAARLLQTVEAVTGALRG